MEFALVAGLLLVLVFGIIEFGKAYSELGVLNSAARAGARAAAVRADEDEVQEAVTDAADPYEVDSPVQIVTETGAPICTSETQGESVSVGWDQSFEINIPLIPDFAQDVRVQGVFRCE